jgi:hypothetical protein
LAAVSLSRSLLQAMPVRLSIPTRIVNPHLSDCAKRHRQRVKPSHSYRQGCGCRCISPGQLQWRDWVGVYFPTAQRTRRERSYLWRCWFYRPTCDGSLQTFELIVTSNNARFAKGVALAQANFSVCSCCQCASAQQTKQIQLVK